jgi:hypothetical protein
MWQLPDGICFQGQKLKLTPVRPISSVIQKKKIKNLFFHHDFLLEKVREAGTKN